VRHNSADPERVEGAFLFLRRAFRFEEAGQPFDKLRAGGDWGEQVADSFRKVAFFLLKLTKLTLSWAKVSTGPWPRERIP